jgi:hypothetical protein
MRMDLSLLSQLEVSLEEESQVRAASVSQREPFYAKNALEYRSLDYETSVVAFLNFYSSFFPSSSGGGIPHELSCTNGFGSQLIVLGKKLDDGDLLLKMQLDGSTRHESDLRGSADGLIISGST